MTFIKKRHNTTELELATPVERNRSSATHKYLRLSGMPLLWRDRVWSLLLIVLLVICLMPYLRATVATLRHGLSPSISAFLPLFLIVGASAITLFSLMRPIWALAAFFAVAPVTSGLVILVGIGDPALQRKAGLLGVELLFLSLAIGLLLRRVIWPDSEGTRRVENGVAVYTLAVLASMTLFYLSDPWWWDRLILAWRHIPSGRQISPNHPLRAGLLILASLLFYRFTASRLKTLGEIRLVCRSWLVGALLTGAYGLSVWATWKRGQYNQVESLFEDGGTYGSYLVITLFIAWGEWLVEKEPWARVLAGLTLFLTVWMIPLTDSRIAIIAAMAGAGIAYTVLTRSMKVRWIRWIPAAFASGILLFPFWGGRAVIQRVFQASPGLTSSMGLQRITKAIDTEVLLRDYWQGGRQSFAVAGFRMIKENPVFGLGPGNAYREMGRGHYYGPDAQGYSIERQHENLHNSFIQVAAETGLLGFVGFMWIVLAVLIRGFSRNLGEGDLLTRFLTIGVGSYLITALTSHPLIHSRQALLFWGSLGILSACTQLGHASFVARLYVGTSSQSKSRTT